MDKENNNNENQSNGNATLGCAYIFMIIFIISAFIYGLVADRRNWLIYAGVVFVVMVIMAIISGAKDDTSKKTNVDDIVNNMDFNYVEETAKLEVLEKYSRLNKEGTITNAEFDEIKRKILE